MLKLIPEWFARRKHRRRLESIRHCSLYIVEDACLALPTIMGRTTFPDLHDMAHATGSLANPGEVGKIVLHALDLANIKNYKTKSVNYAAHSRDFLDRMERYRHSTGIGKRRFESRMELIHITQKDGQIVLEKTTPRHGRFAFEGTGRAEDRIALPVSAAPESVGRTVQALRASKTG
jgi:hypothetical protein